MGRILIAVLVAAPALLAQSRTPKAAAPVDLTGYWVSIVTEDWRWRMVTPIKGDFASIPINAEARKVADEAVKDQLGEIATRANLKAVALEMPVVCCQKEGRLRPREKAVQKEFHLLEHATGPCWLV